jgi:tetratricopeptide (TPR) repeat protein/DNA-binding XRE family transcriptional regulator
MTGDATVLGNRIRERRFALGLSQKELAGSGVSASYVSLIESGKRWPTLDVLEILAERLDTTSRALVSGKEEPTALGKEGPLAFGKEGPVAFGKEGPVGLGKEGPSFSGKEQPMASGKEGPTASGKEGPTARDMEQVELDLRWAKIALRAGNAASAETSARAVLREPTRTESQRHDALIVLAGAFEAQGRLEKAIDVLEPLLEVLDSDATRELWQTCQVTLCRCYKEVGDFAHAIDLGERVLASKAVMTDDQIMLAISLADAYQRRGDVKRAGRLLESILGRSEVTGSHYTQGAALWNASLVADVEGRIDDAIRLSERALALFGESDAVRNLGRLRTTYAIYLREQSATGVPLAREQLNRALDEFGLEGSVIDRARCLTELARCALDEDDLVEAETLILRAVLEIAEDSPVERAYVDLVRGHVMVRNGQVDEGLLIAHKAARMLHDNADSPHDAAQAWRELAALAGSIGRERLVVGALEQAVEALGVRSTRVGASRAGTVVDSAPVEHQLAGPVESRGLRVPVGR